ncbi:MAG: (deoxy)nucleoside triphosphate pyrophosphohydrolase [Deltaproteobacteria bacterium]|nr:MAG: (deoxy)nucleoside triphosphate pyrophosphohydrolase [Deltaproteobacteria bacterium]
MARRIRVVAAMIEKEGRYLITQRRPEAVLPLLWEFPGGRVEAGESDEAALRREIMEKIGVEVEVGEEVMAVDHSYPEYEVELRVYRARIARGEVSHKHVHDHRWVRAAELDAYEFPGADARTVALLLGASE